MLKLNIVAWDKKGEKEYEINKWSKRGEIFIENGGRLLYPEDYDLLLVDEDGSKQKIELTSELKETEEVSEIGIAGVMPTQSEMKEELDGLSIRPLDK